MKIITNTFLFSLIMLYILSWTNVLWNLTGYVELTMWYWIAWFGGAVY